MRKTRRHGIIIRSQLSEFVLPPIDDGLVLGLQSPIGHVAVGKALSLLTTTSFEHLQIEDDVIGDVIVRTAILRKISADDLRAYVLDEIKPIMGPEEIIHLKLQVDVIIETRGP
ncbi:hypothetical protein [Ralstonia sp.]|uniref:hypothetical protein n=1 Tax=Ralstonia sp. TaxID=54061 RepID=UPI00257DAED4|nr:hypothetical protein [Ralstonia sp.]MBA4281924.1 hypothetical protein [Ralstonia sp.]